MLLQPPGCPYAQAQRRFPLTRSPSSTYQHEQTIMEQKVQVLVDNVADSACAVLDLVAVSEKGSGSGGGGGGGINGHRQGVPSSTSTGEETPSAGAGSSSTPAARDAAGRALSKDVGQLRRLVQAAITALRNAEIEDQQRTKDVATAEVEAAAVAVERTAGSGSAAAAN